jgi:hypothetical protein
VAGGLVWTFGQNGHLYGLDPATGEVRQQAAVGVPANHFPTPGIGAGLMLIPGGQDVVAFRTSAAAVGHAAGAVSPVHRANPAPRPAGGGPMIAGVALGCLAAGASSSFIWFTRRRRRT